MKSRFPWRIEDRGPNKPLNILYPAMGHADAYVAQVYEAEDAEFILRAAHSHDDMLGALKAQEAADEANEVRLGYSEWQVLEDKAKALRVAAIAKAEGRIA